MARLLEVIDLDHQYEVVRNADLARHFQQGAGRRQVAHAAVDAAGAVEGDTSRFQRAVTRGFALLIHDQPPSGSVAGVPCWHGQPMRAPVRRFDRYNTYRRGALADNETDHLNTNVCVR